MINFVLISILASVLSLIALFSLWYLQRKKRRAKHLTHKAGYHGFLFDGDIDATPKDKFAPLRLFSLRVPGKMKNVLKRNNPSIWIFDYEYCIPRDQDVGQTVVVIEMRGIKWPPTVIETRKKERFTVAAMRLLTQKLANWQLSYKEVDFSIHPKFAESYRVFCKNDPKNMKELLTAPFLEFLVQNPGWNVEAMNQWLLIYRQGQYLKPKEFDTFTNLALTIYKLIEKD
jgi:hypothetical protein